MPRLSLPIRTMTALIALGTLGACAESGPTAPAAPAAVGRTAVVAISTGAQACRPDSKLLGQITLSTRDEPGTWWHLTRTGLDAAGITDHLAAINGEFGTNFPDLDTALFALVDAVRALDTNGNGMVCAYTGRGALGWNDDPTFWYYHFLVRDDKHAGS